MESTIAQELKLKYKPVAIIFTNEKPDRAVQFVKDRWGCVISMLAAATKGKVAAFDRERHGCGGGAVGLGLCDSFDHVPGGIEYFLSTGRGEGYPEGERFKKTPELARNFVEQLPVLNIPYSYVVFKPLHMVELEVETPELVVMLCNPDQLSALGVLANYDRPTADNVTMPFGAGCHTICILPYHEAHSGTGKAVVGLTDVYARPFIEPDILSFTVGYERFLEMERNVRGSFFDADTWKRLRGRIGA
ncbi:MAG: hypothetical protein A2Z18_04900 [Armatimonadetes bacterium RBG_16_58_9]|nr:MAG: hypothetical protein A2Z18_04900 [Armatimonadetes bacterium RBG_16_58_9]